MIDFKKEIKLSDLVRRTEKAGKRSKKTSKGKVGEVVGLKVGATQLAAARVENNGSHRLLQLARQPLPPGIVSEGEVVDQAALAAGLDEFFSVNNLPRKNVRLGVATNHVGVRIFEITGIEDEHQLANAVLFRAHDVVSIPVEEAVIDYRVIGESVDESGAPVRRILLVAAYKDPIERHTAAVRAAGIDLVGVDLEAFGLLRATGLPPAGDTGPTAAQVVVNCGHERTTLAISNGEICEFTRMLEWGGSKVEDAIRYELSASAEEAHQILRQLDLSSTAAAESPTFERVVRAREAARRETLMLVRELVASLEFYQRQQGALPVAEILLAGGMSQVSGFASELERQIRKRVRLVDPLGCVEVDESLADQDDLAAVAIPIGLGVEI